MEEAISQVRARSPGERALVRRFSEKEALTVEYPNVVHAVASYGSQEREIEAAKWRPQFEDKHAASKVQLDRLGVEAKELQKIIKAFPGAGTGKDWGLEDVQTTVKEAKKTWEGKKRLFSGKPQKVYHDVMCNLDAHSGLLSMLPQSNDYVTLVSGAVKTVVKASVNHRKNIEMLTKALKEVNDEAHACQVDGNLIKSEAVQTAIAKFYIALFLFYGDVIKWYESSSSRKFWHSLQDNFSDHFKDSLVNLHRLSQVVRRAAASGQGAELRVARLGVEGGNEDLRAGLSGIARENAELRLNQERIMLEQKKQTAAIENLADPEAIQAMHEQLWLKAGLSGTALLLGQKENEDAERFESVDVTQTQLLITTGDEVAPDTDTGAADTVFQRQHTMVEIAQSIEPLLNSITLGVRAIDPMFPPSMSFDQRITIPLERWTLAKTSTILYLESSAMCTEPHLSQLTAAASRIVDSAAQLSIPTISFFCDIPRTLPYSEGHNSAQQENILGLIYSLTFQLTQIIPPLTETQLPFQFSQLASLDLQKTSWTAALQLFTHLLELAPPLLILVIDGFHALESIATNPDHTHEFAAVLQKAMGAEGKVFKVLFTDSKRGFSLINEIPMQNREIIEGVRRSGMGRSGGRVSAGRGFVEFGF